MPLAGSKYVRTFRARVFAANFGVSFSEMRCHLNYTQNIQTTKQPIHHQTINIFFYTVPDKEKNQCIREKNRSSEYSKGNKTVPGRVATTHTEDGHKQDT